MDHIENVHYIKQDDRSINVRKIEDICDIKTNPL